MWGPRPSWYVGVCTLAGFAVGILVLVLAIKAEMEGTSFFAHTPRVQHPHQIFGLAVLSGLASTGLLYLLWALTHCCGRP